MKKNIRIISYIFMASGLLLGFQNCSSGVPAGESTNLSQGGNPGAGTDTDDNQELSQTIQPPIITPVDPGSGGSGGGDSETRLSAFQNRCADTSGVYSDDGTVQKCTYDYPALQVPGDIGRMIWAHINTENNAYWEPSGRDFQAEVHAELACKQIIGGNNVFPHGDIRLVPGSPSSRYWDFHNGQWEQVESPAETTQTYLLISEIGCRFYNQDAPVGNNNITF